MQSMLNVLHTWRGKWRLVVNEAKTKISILEIKQSYDLVFCLHVEIKLSNPPSAISTLDSGSMNN